MTIEELLAKLTLWRKNKKSNRDRIPEEIWAEAIKLASETSASAVATKLSLSIVDLKKRMGLPARDNKIIFKELPPVSSSKSPLLEFITPSGIRIKVYS